MHAKTGYTMPGGRKEKPPAMPVDVYSSSCFSESDIFDIPSGPDFANLSGFNHFA
jgi:hypothetical protein